MANPANIPAAATEPRKIPPVESFGGREWGGAGREREGEGEREREKTTKPEVKKMDTNKFQTLFKNQFRNSKNDS